MKKQDYYFDLPPSLIAQYPLENRSDARLLTYDRKNGMRGHHQFSELTHFLEPGDLLVVNDSKVIPARLYGQKTTGGKVELLVERVQTDQIFLAHIKASKALKSGGKIILDKNWQIQVLERKDDLFLCETNGNIYTLLESLGHMPLPLYITRPDIQSDLERYQTIYAQNKGSVAAPTAGLHFDKSMLEKVKQAGIQIASLTLHIGAGTFRPVRCDNIVDHKMHSEYVVVSESICHLVKQTKAQGNRVIAVGTTALRALESAAASGELHPYSGDTDIFIYPGYIFKICDGLITNFHLPESTLLMLVSAFIGREQTLSLYQEAIKHQYRFFSYGDTSLLL